MTKPDPNERRTRVAGVKDPEYDDPQNGLEVIEYSDTRAVALTYNDSLRDDFIYIRREQLPTVVALLERAMTKPYMQVSGAKKV